VLQTQVRIHKPNEAISLRISAIWDTGATGSVISKQTIEKLGLAQTGFKVVSTANGTIRKKSYTIDIELPNKVLVQGLVATETEFLYGDCDALIGMDIITLGDFSITNHKGDTCFSFRIPSSHVIDYLTSSEFGRVKVISPRGPKGHKGN
jgi:predicted aspartyl protease